ncbi:gas vesicle protein [Paracraurococcus ruber]|uniref:Gas vesicle protein n=1 Tax=Paracraurococcus ruber TaxID=77675 RepID=A0ABS1D6D1_9PROT|nr:gas vesicle protein GvpJ [Paracraurococcus ruber]MBK1661880.1 gas vesicle protein [Paracraurococcus ruber]TDG23003.1 gas vesicle protein [Paracraurococcus ruber]
MQHSVAGSGLADVLERILDKGIVVAGDISVSLVGVELLTIRLRLVVASVDRALEMGIRWWEADAALTGRTEKLVAENAALAARVEKLEGMLAGGRA